MVRPSRHRLIIPLINQCPALRDAFQPTGSNV